MSRIQVVICLELSGRNFRFNGVSLEVPSLTYFLQIDIEYLEFIFLKKTLEELFNFDQKLKDHIRLSKEKLLAAMDIDFNPGGLSRTLVLYIGYNENLSITDKYS